MDVLINEYSVRRRSTTPPDSHMTPSMTPPNTARAYANDWADFLWWCGEQGIETNAADGVDLSDYLRDLLGRGYACSSVVRAYSGIVSHLRQLAPAAWPKGHRPPECAELLRDLRRRSLSSPRMY
jgi:hypothetical protein